MVRQDLLRERSIDVSLRTVERAVAPFRRLLTAEAKATVRFETPPGLQLPIDFGQVRVPIADERVGVFLFVATLGYSRRIFSTASVQPRQCGDRPADLLARHIITGDPPQPPRDRGETAIESDGGWLAGAVYAHEVGLGRDGRQRQRGFSSAQARVCQRIGVPRR